jgi:hypothetical protein
MPIHCQFTAALPSINRIFTAPHLFTLTYCLHTKAARTIPKKKAAPNDSAAEGNVGKPTKVMLYSVAKLGLWVFSTDANSLTIYCCFTVY